MYHGPWVGQKVLLWYNHNTTQWLVVIKQTVKPPPCWKVLRKSITHFIVFEITSMQRAMMQASYIILTFSLL